MLTILATRRGMILDFYDRFLTGPIAFPMKDYDLVCIYSNTPCFKDTLRIMNHYQGKTKIAVGGPHTSIYPHTLQGVDWICQGEGERLIVDLVNGRIKPGIVKYPRIENLDDLPLPDYERFSKMPYLLKAKWIDDYPIYNYNSSRGCPFACTFCDTKRIWGRKYTCFSAERVVGDMEYLKNKYGIRGIYFREDNFTCNKIRLLDICEKMIKRNLNLSWLCETRVDTIDEKIIKLMARAGCKVFYVGFESGSQRMLDLYNKGTTIEQGLNVCRWARENGIKIAGSFIIKHPAETNQDVKATNDFIVKSKMAAHWVNPFRPSFDRLVEDILNPCEKRGN